MSQALPPQPYADDGVDAMEGEACHELAANKLTGLPDDYETAGNGVRIDDDMRAAADEYVAVVRKTSDAFPEHGLHIEQKVRIPAVHPDCFGTVDASIHTDTTLYIWDLKYGFGYVDAWENWQLLTYACGLVTDQTKRIVLTIVQPRCPTGDTIKVWALSIEQFVPYREQVHAAAAEVMYPGTKCRSGPQCRYCPARHTCETAIKAGMSQWEMTGPPVPDNLTPGQMAHRLAIVQRAKEQIGYLETGLSEQIKSMLKAGQTVPGYSLMPKRGNKTWDRPAAEVINMGKLLDLELAKPVQPITPTQAIKAGLNEDVANRFSSRKSSGLNLVRQTEKTIRKQFECHN